MTSSSGCPTLPQVNSANLATLGEILKASCVELLAEYGLEAKPSTASLPSEPPVSVLVAGVDFRGNELRGTVALWAARTVFKETTRGAAGLNAEEGDLPDWACELANQLVGRMKNKLRAYDVSLNLNVPRLINESGMAELERGVRHRFSCDFGAIAACLDVLITEGFLLQPRDPEEALIQEGEFALL
jgi:hypothetical protein